MLIPVKRSVAVMIFNGYKVLSVRRSDQDDELRGIWGLPAGTFRGSETLEDLISRIGRDKLGAQLAPVRKLVSGRQIRSQYLLEMDLWEASIEGIPSHPEWRGGTIVLPYAGPHVGFFCFTSAVQNKTHVT